jgi:alpha-tubulin suppressor-like RCC1 family protein
VYHSCARLGDTGRVLCWGRGGYLGDGTISGSSTPREVPGISAATWLAVGGGESFGTNLAASCAILQDGSARCWGDNGQGQLGDGTNAVRLSPVTVMGLSGAIEITVGGAHACALLNDGTARCWGANGNGQLGDGTRIERLTPVPVMGLSTVAHLSAGERHTCAELLDGTVMCWGENSSGELGRGATSLMPSPTPALVSGLVGVSALGASSQSTCAYSADRVTRCWGNNQYGQLGIGADTTSRPVPTAVAW